MKIGIIDDGIDQAHPVLQPVGLLLPGRLPEGEHRYTTPKVIVARAFPRLRRTGSTPDRPFDPLYSIHATHVAGIAAGDYDTPTGARRRSAISGIAPKAYLGNYKALTVPDRRFRPRRELARDRQGDRPGRDGRDERHQPLHRRARGRAAAATSSSSALDNAAAAGVVPVVAAGNDFDATGLARSALPANAPAAITVAASTSAATGRTPDHHRRLLVRPARRPCRSSPSPT